MQNFWIVGLLTATAAAAVFGFYLWHRCRNTIFSAEQAAKQVFLEHVRSFADCLQPLQEAVAADDQEEVSTIMEELESRMTTLPALSAFMPKDGGQWLRQAEQWGISHDCAGDEFEITMEYRKRYIFNDVYGGGAKAKVLRPAWYVAEDGSCIQKGCAAILRGGKEHE